MFSVDRFVEKPDRATAQRFVDSGAFFWNSGIFLLSARAYLGELSRINPAMLEACERAVRDGQEDLAFFRLGAEPFGEAPSLSIDHAVMEHTSRAAVVPVDMAWSDVGSWPALRDIATADGDGNVLQGDVLAERMTQLLHPQRRPAGRRGRPRQCRGGRDRRRRAGRRRRLRRRGLGHRRQAARRRTAANRSSTSPATGRGATTASVDAGDRFQVKRITVKPGAKLSLQKHYHRAEHWVVVHGTAIVQRGEERMLVRENESVYIPIGTEHRLENPGKLPLQLIEVQSGPYLGEDDIVRVSDSYGRA